MSSRPIILHQSTKRQLDSLLASKNLNSIGINGQKGSGKSFLAAYLAENILQINNAETWPYVKIVNCAEDVGIEEIREIKVFLRLKVPTSSSFSRCVIIKHLDALGIAAQNALLKTIEEPPIGTVMVITTSSKNIILPTINSRLQWINLLPLSKNQLADDFFNTFERQNLERAYLMTQGNAANLISLAADLNARPDLAAAFAEAKNLLSCTRFEKLARIEQIIKSETYSLDQLLDAMAKILRMLIINNAAAENVINLTKKLDSILKARESLKYNPSQKLLLSSLFNKL